MEVKQSFMVLYSHAQGFDTVKRVETIIIFRSRVLITEQKCSTCSVNNGEGWTYVGLFYAITDTLCRNGAIDTTNFRGMGNRVTISSSDIRL